MWCALRGFLATFGEWRRASGMREINGVRIIGHYTSAVCTMCLYISYIYAYCTAYDSTSTVVLLPLPISMFWWGLWDDYV